MRSLSRKNRTRPQSTHKFITNKKLVILKTKIIVSILLENISKPSHLYTINSFAEVLKSNNSAAIASSLWRDLAQFELSYKRKTLNHVVSHKHIFFNVQTLLLLRMCKKQNGTMCSCVIAYVLAALLLISALWWPNAEGADTDRRIFLCEISESLRNFTQNSFSPKIISGAILYSISVESASI